MKIHILGICGTFMGGIALLARELGHEVAGSDSNVYPPMSTQLQQSGITLYDGYAADPLESNAPDIVIIGNALSRGNPAVEYVLNSGLSYTSGPQWLLEHVLAGRHVLAVSGTHGKTTTTAMLAWVLEYAGKNPGFLIGGVAENFGVSARLGGDSCFVVEADEYDTAFFDKRSKFIHYRPNTLIINNIEFDHADIFGDIIDIIREFRRLVRVVPANGQIIHKQGDPHINTVFESGCWTPTVGFGASNAAWQAQANKPDMSGFGITHNGHAAASVNWDLIGQHNAENALAVMAAAARLNISPELSAEALGQFKSVKRRLQRLAVVNGVSVYDDFAHHPTAIRVTLNALRASVGNERIYAVFEPRSNTMKMGTHRDTLAGALVEADEVIACQPEKMAWDLQDALSALAKLHVFTGTAAIIDYLLGQLRPGDHVLIMSNGSFGGLHNDLIRRLGGQQTNGAQAQ